MADTIKIAYLLDPFYQVQDHNGLTVAGAQIFVYQAGTTIHANTFKNFNGALNTWPVLTDTLGNATVLADVAKTYDVLIKDQNGNLLMSKQNLVPGGAGEGGGSITPVEPIDQQHWIGIDGEPSAVPVDLAGTLLHIPTSTDEYQGFIVENRNDHIVLSDGLYMIHAVINFQQDSDSLANEIENLTVMTGLSYPEDVIFERDEAGHDASSNIHSLKMSFVRHAVEQEYTNELVFRLISPVELSSAYISRLSIVKLQTAGYGSDPQPVPSNVLTESDLGLNQSSQIVSIRNYPIASAGCLPAIPQYTVRLQFVRGYIPSGDSKFSYSLVSSEENIWDITKVYDPTDFSSFLSQSTYWDGEISSIVAAYVKRVVGVNSTGVTKFNNMFSGCTNFINEYVPMDTTSGTEFRALFYNCQNLIYLPDYFIDTQNGTDLSYMLSHTGLLNAPMLNTSSATTMRDFLNSTKIKRSPLYDTSNATDLGYMFNSCSNLVEVPLLDTSSCTDMHNMFNSCSYVESGALALYQQASTQSTEVTDHGGTFYRCGSSTTTGRAELDQIPADWKAYG